MPEDLPNAMTAAEVTEKLGLHNLRHRHLEKKQFLQGLYWVDFPGPKIISKLFLAVKNLIHNFDVQYCCCLNFGENS